MTVFAWEDTSTIASLGTEVDVEDVATILPDGYSLYGLQDALNRLSLNWENSTYTINNDLLNEGLHFETEGTFSDYTITQPTLFYERSDSNAVTLSDVMTVTFFNVASFNNRQLNAVFKINEVQIGEQVNNSNSSYNTGYIMICYFDNIGVHVSIGTSTKVFADTSEDILNYTISLQWADDGSDFDYGFYQLAYDIDTGNINENWAYFRESYEMYDQYIKSYYVSSENTNIIKKTSDTTVFAANGTGDVSTQPENYDQVGFLAATNGANIRGKVYYSSGWCGNLIRIFVDTALSSLTKTESVSSYNTYDDTTNITYTVTYPMPEFYVDTFNLYKELSLYDILPSGVTYKSAKVINGDTNADITSKGTLSYESSSKTVTFAFSNDYISDMSNYAGQDIILTITATVSGTTSYENTAYATVSGVDINSNTVTVDPLYKITTEVVNGTIDDDVTETAKGSDETISYSPNSGYAIKSVTVDGTSVSIDTYETSYDFTNITGNHTIKVVYAPASRTITITKKVKKSDINYSNGTPTFVFHLEGTDINGDTYSYNQIASMDESLAADSNGYISVSCTFNVNAGTYKSTEDVCSRYEFDSTESLVNATAGGSTVTYDVKTNTSASATYINKITNFGGFSDATSVINNCGATN